MSMTDNLPDKPAPGEGHGISYKACQLGTCVVLDGDNAIVYAGPIDKVPRGFMDGKTMLMHPDDFKQLHDFMAKHRH